MGYTLTWPGNTENSLHGLKIIIHFFTLPRTPERCCGEFLPDAPDAPQNESL